MLSALAYDDRVVVERYRDGARDLAVGVLDNEDGPRALPVVEAIPQGRELYDFDARYTPGLTEFTAPADLGRRAGGGGRADRARRLPRGWASAASAAST